MRAANGKKFSRLWVGDTSRYATAETRARAKPTSPFARCWVSGAGRRRPGGSALAAVRAYRQKWERADYRALTLAVALDREEFWGGG